MIGYQLEEPIMIQKTIMIFLSFWMLWSGCASEKNLEHAFEQLQSSMSKIAAFKERCEATIKSPEENVDKPEAVYYLGRLNELFAHYEDAIQNYRYLLILFPEDLLVPESLYRIGYIYENNLGDRIKAKEAYHQLICFYPGSSFTERALISHAQLSCEQKEWYQAMEYFELYKDNYPESKIKEDIRFRLADILLSGVKDTVKAEAVYRQFLEDHPHSSWCKFAEKKLDSIQKPE
jgi:TolA-binding protein